MCVDEQESVRQEGGEIPDLLMRNLWFFPSCSAGGPTNKVHRPAAPLTDGLDTKAGRRQEIKSQTNGVLCRPWGASDAPCPDGASRSELSSLVFLDASS